MIQKQKINFEKRKIKKHYIVYDSFVDYYMRRARKTRTFGNFFFKICQKSDARDKAKHLEEFCGIYF